MMVEPLTYKMMVEKREEDYIDVSEVVEDPLVILLVYNAYYLENDNYQLVVHLIYLIIDPVEE